MSALSSAPVEVLLRKLQTNSQITEGERQGLKELPIAPRMLRADQDIVRQGDRPSQCSLLLSGWAYRYKVLGSGKRQIVAFHLPGDMPDLQSLLLPVADHNIATLSEAVVALVPHAQMRDFLARHPSLAPVFWRDTLIDAAIFRESMVNIGQRPATERIAHLLCETCLRLESIGLAEQVNGSRAFAWPVTQIELADASGLSSVHVNRTLQELRARGLIATKQGHVTIPDWDRLKALAEFVPDYLALNAA
ncbi:MAG TPA: Crp/Fnr family transcriptional regulator [Mesorhizobium sp.]|jgi:CRP-like cAMP-binding protein|nr:Crp/Fnr family transcriptional regulator [Mesorhizobium sp.]